MTLGIALWIAAGVVEFIGLLALFGWYRHKLELDVSFEEVAALGCHIEGEPGRNVTPELVAVWFAEETQAREATSLAS
jgi:hypothetical protein